MTPKTTKTLELPKPGQNYKDDDAIEVEKYEITTKTTVKMLKDRLEVYGLPRDGKRDVLIGRLEEFANDRTSWRSLFQPPRKRKRGAQTGKRKDAHSAKRIATMFCKNEPQPIPHQYRYEGTYRQIPQGRTQFQVMQLDDWTDSALADCGDASQWEDAQRVEKQRQAAEKAAKLADCPHGSELRPNAHTAEEVGLSGDGGYSGTATMRRMSLRLNHVDDKLEQVLKMQHLLVGTGEGPGISAQSAFTHAYHPAPAGTIAIPIEPQPQPGPQCQPEHAASLAAAPPSPSLLTTSPPADASEIPSKHAVTLELGGITLTVDRRSIPDPPAQHFSDQISNLFSEWDFGTLLKICGHPIALKYWPKVYQDRAGVKRGVWNALKVEFANWKYLVEEKERLGSEEAFWAHHCKEDGTPLCYQHILNQLKHAREEENRNDADAARRFFGQNLQREDAKGAFEYVKKGKRIVYVKDKAIAEAWRGLLTCDPFIAAQWEAIQVVDTLTSVGIPLSLPSSNSVDNV